MSLSLEFKIYDQNNDAIFCPERSFPVLVLNHGMFHSLMTVDKKSAEALGEDGYCQTD